MQLGDKIRIVRKKAFLTQEEFAARLDVTISTINRWENNRVRPNFKAMRKIKDFCTSNGILYDDIEIEWLKNGRRSDDYE